MKLTVAGKDRSGDFGQSIADSAKARAKSKDAPEFLTAECSALSLLSAEDDRDFLNRFTQLLLENYGVNTLDFYIPRGPGLRGAIVARCRRLLWKLLRYQQDRIVFQQNVINMQHTAAVEFMQEQHDREIAELRSRISSLERDTCHDA